MAEEKQLASLRAAKRSSRRRKAGDDGEVLSEHCPVVALGHRDGKFYFFDVAGQLRILSAQQIDRPSQILALFGGDVTWCVAHFPQLDREGNPTNWFSARNVAAALLKRCFDSGLFSADEPQRGVGVWRATGRVAVHLGDRVFWPDDSSEQPAGFRARGALWPAHPAIPSPAPPCGLDVVDRVVELFGRWNWLRDGKGPSGASDAAVFLGLWAAGLLGAAIPWRPHGLVVGPTGSGKSSLMNLYVALSPLTVATNDYTEAGIRQSLTGRAAPLFLDEADEDPEAMGRLQRVIGLLRRASGGSGAQTVRGTGDGHAQRFEVMSPALLGAVLPPPLLPQDSNRISRVDLLPRPMVGGKGLPSDEEISWVEQHAAALWGRALAGLPRFQANLAALREAFLGRGCSPRLADQVGTILAARGMMLSDEPMNGSDVEEAILAAGWLVQSAAQQDVDDGGPAQCLRHLLSSRSGVVDSGVQLTIGTLVARARTVGDPTIDAERADRALAEIGLTVRRWPKAAATLSLLVANSHEGLTGVFAHTRWAGKRWAEDLRRLPGADVPSNSEWFRSSFKGRAVVLPEELLPEISTPSSRDSPDEGGTR